MTTQTNENPGSAPQPIDGKTFAIGVLGITACVLFVGLLMLSFRPTPTYGIGQSDRGGDYIMFTQQVSNSNESVVIIDAAAQRMSLYALDYSTKQLRLLQSNVPLDRLPGSKPPAREPEQRP